VHPTIISVSVSALGGGARRRRRWVVASLLGCVVAVAAACGSSAALPKTKTGVPMEVSLDHGRTVVLKATLPYGSNAMRDLERAARLQTSYGGKFVSAIDGHAQDTATSTYWLLYIDCRPASVGATEITLKKGETVWWDLRKTAAALPSTPDPACPFKH